jgi:hypothetical protein
LGLLFLGKLLKPPFVREAHTDGKMQRDSEYRR